MAKHEQATITKAEALKALLRSGYLLESRIEKVLAERGYFVQANSVYTDPLTSKSREIDLSAIGALRLWKEYNFLFRCFLVECVNNPQPIIFITKEAQAPFLFHNDLKISGLPLKILEEGEEESWEMLSDFLLMDKFHHYCEGRVATQFCSFKKKGNKKDWMAFHDDQHFDCIRKLCDAVDYFSEDHLKGWSFGDDEPVNLQIYYPVIVVQGALFDARPSKKSVRLYKANHIQYRQAAITRGEEMDYQIDVVTEAYFPQYVDMIEDEIEKMARRMQRRKPRIIQSIDAIVHLAKKAKDEKGVLEAMKF
jgi:hypothetical protein